MVIVAAVDESDRAADVIEESMALADVFGDEIHMVHVLTAEEFVNLEHTSIEETGEPMPVEDIRSVAAAIVEDIITPFDGPFNTVGLFGDPADSVVEYAAERDTRYIVTAGRKRSPAGKAIFGSVAQSIIMNANSPVVITIDRGS